MNKALILLLAVLLPINLFGQVLSHINVRAAGATGNGTTDDTVAIQQAINTAVAGDVVFFPRGTYKISELLINKSGITLQGSGHDALLKSSLNTTRQAIRIESTVVLTNITVRDLSIQGDYTNAFSRGIFVGRNGSIGGVEASLFENLKIYDFQYAGIVNTNQSSFSRSTIRHCWIDHIGDFGINMRHGTNSIIDGNHITRLASVNYPSHGIYFAEQSHNGRVINNYIGTISGVGSSGIAVSYGSRNVVLFGNTIEDGVAGIQVDSGTDADGVLMTTSGTTITANAIRGMSLDGIKLYQYADNIAIVGNTISNAANGIKLDSGGTIRITNVVVSGNVIFANSDKPIILTGADRVAITGNHIDPMNATVYSLDVLDSTQINVTGNLIRLGERGIMLRGNSTNINVAANILVDGDSAGGGYGIRIGASTVTDANITDNDLTGTTGTISDVGTRTFIVGNRLSGAPIFRLNSSLDWNSTGTWGLRLNNLTTAQRDALSGTVAGALIWNTTTATVQRYSGASWADVGSAPTEGAGIDVTGSVVSWDPVTFVNSFTLWDSSQTERAVTFGLSGATDPVMTLTNDLFKFGSPLQTTAAGGGALTLSESAADQTTPADDNAVLYAKNDFGETKFYYRTKDGTVTGPLVGMSHAALASATTNYTVNFGGVPYLTITADSDINFEMSTNRAAVRVLNLLIYPEGSVRALSFPASWTFIGSASPTSIASGKLGKLVLECWGTSETNVIAGYAESP